MNENIEKLNKFLVERRLDSNNTRVNIWPDVPESFPSINRPRTNHCIGFVGSERLYQTLRWELNILLLTPDSWKSSLRHADPEFLLIESTFETATGHWEYSQSGNSNAQQELGEMLDFSKCNGIPTVFWHTLDYRYCSHFVEFSKLFEHVFCADKRAIIDFETQGIESRLLLPAVQTALFNPFNRYPDLEIDILYDGIADLHRLGSHIDILDQIAPMGLKVIDSKNIVYKNKMRQLKTMRSSVLGCVLSSDLPSILRATNVLFTISDDLKTETSKQWDSLEALASRVPIVNYGGISDDDFRQGFVRWSDDEIEIFDELKKMKEEPEYRAIVAHQGWRNIHRDFSASKRLQEIFSILDIEHKWNEYPKATVFTPTNRLELLPEVVSHFEKQTYPNKELYLVLNTDETTPGWLIDKCSEDVGIRYKVLPRENFTGACIKIALEAAEGSYFFKMDDDDSYGENYVMDMILNERVVDADIFGKCPRAYFHFDGEEIIYRSRYKGIEFKTASAKEMEPSVFWIAGNTISGKTEALRNIAFSPNTYAGAETSFLLGACESNNSIALFEDLNVIVNRSENVQGHTWRNSSNQIKHRCIILPVNTDELMKSWNDDQSCLGMIGEMQKCDDPDDKPPNISASNTKIKEEIVACLASIPERVTHLEITIQSIISQIDHLYVYLNDYPTVPSYLNNPKITYFLSQDHGDMAAAGKFYMIDTVKDGYYLCLDDDIIYPEDYVDKMVNTLVKYNNSVAVSVHGSMFGEPLEWYFERTTVFPFKDGMSSDKFVTLIGSGCLAFYRPSIKLTFSDFFPKVMCDLTFSVKAREQGLLLVTPKRKANWLIVQDVPLDKRYYERMLYEDGGRTKLAKKYNWEFESYKQLIEDWRDKHYPDISLKEIRELEMDYEVFCALYTGLLPNSWNPELSNIFYRRKLQFNRMRNYKRKLFKIFHEMPNLVHLPRVTDVEKLKDRIELLKKKSWRII